MPKLSDVMLRALVAIDDHGGRAVAQGGGAWLGDDGEVLTYEPPAPSLQNVVFTNTIYALEARGMLAREDTEKPVYRHQAPRRMTDRARQVIEEISG